MHHSTSDTTLFKGPLFIVGLSRSGTQLLRELLNRHERVCIPVRESHFIPRLLSYSHSRDKEQCARIVEIVECSNFISDLRNLNQAPSKEEIISLADSHPVNIFIEELMKRCTNKYTASECISGDKTPNNMLHMRLLKSYFPLARFLHIIRDPRERSLSTKKRWGAHPFASAIQWRKQMHEALEQCQTSLGLHRNAF
jgi:hypothetical protein